VRDDDNESVGTVDALRLSRDGLLGALRMGDLDGAQEEGWDGRRKCPDVSEAERLSLLLGGWIGVASSRGEIADTGLNCGGVCSLEGC
jgi:hypothetical protein